MDYRYIEQLMERYFRAETTLEEERILRTFFSQHDLPEEMNLWKSLFTIDSEPGLGADFDERILSMIDSDGKKKTTGNHAVKAIRISLKQSFMPLFKSAAVVAIILTLGNAAQTPWDSSWSSSPESYAEVPSADTVVSVSPVQAEYTGELPSDSTRVSSPSSTSAD